ncbi:hypothetical protein Ddye_030646 [Dipteronia dyeriana]|uniref:Uncharacterized protein n=1 Tax=Dipteronia dyeriana TaxID=168575 RepID=A0AAD9THT1_9ROSI|nr:hypothetical protein Ddye_030646 [Dipteronia dyeriana]
MQKMLIRTQTFRLLQLSLPSSPVSCTPKAMKLHQLHCSDSIQSPQLARKINDYIMISSPKTCVPTTPPVAREDKSYNEIVREISALSKKFPVHPNDKMDRAYIATTRQSNLKVGSSRSTTTRGRQRPLDGISMTLERFKIRTVQKGEVVKVEDDQERK